MIRTKNPEEVISEQGKFHFVFPKACHEKNGLICLIFFELKSEVIGLPGGMDNQELWPLIEAIGVAKTW